MSNSIGVFGIAVILGYFILPFLLKREAIGQYLSLTTNSESAWRDHLLNFITKFMAERLNFVTPNVVSIIGFALTFFLIYLFESNSSFGTVFIVALLAGFSDALDGSLARNTGRVTRLGVVLDVARDFFLVVVLSFYLIKLNILAADLFFWFLVGYIFLGVIRNLEFKLASGRILSLEEDFKFLLDRVRLFFYIVGILLLILVPFFPELRTLGETLIVTAIVITWLSVLFHSAHLKILLDEKRGIPEDL